MIEAAERSRRTTEHDDSDADETLAVARAVREGLLAPRKWLPPWLFYDATGSALFEEITRLPEYYLTRTERQLLSEHAPAMMAAVGPVAAIVELGAGSAEKTELLIAATLHRQVNVEYYPVDVSPAALELAAVRLAPRAPRLVVRPVCARYPEELDWLRAVRGPRLVLCLGSNLGNYEPTAARRLLSEVRARLRPGDALLVGVDLRKSSEQLLPAYDDAAGVTARFNKNVLTRLNRQLGANFEPSRFDHVAVWNPEQSRVEMHLRAKGDQVVRIPALGMDVAFAASEEIHTESSYKLSPTALQALIAEAGYAVERAWTDVDFPFTLTLARVPRTE